MKEREPDGLTQIVFALKLINELEIELPVAPVVLINSDEEIGSKVSGMITDVKSATQIVEEVVSEAVEILESKLSNQIRTAR